MRPLFCGFWKDERGSLLVTEWMFVATILLLGVLSTAISVRSRMCQTSVQLMSWNELSPTYSTERAD
jgi:hypothetical protein